MSMYPRMSKNVAVSGKREHSSVGGWKSSGVPSRITRGLEDGRQGEAQHRCHVKAAAFQSFQRHVSDP